MCFPLDSLHLDFWLPVQMVVQRSAEQCSSDRDRARLPLPVCVCMVPVASRSVCAEHPGPGQTRQALNHQASSALCRVGWWWGEKGYCNYICRLQGAAHSIISCVDVFWNIKIHALLPNHCKMVITTRFPVNSSKISRSYWGIWKPACNYVCKRNKIMVVIIIKAISTIFLIFEHLLELLALTFSYNRCLITRLNMLHEQSDGVCNRIRVSFLHLLEQVVQEVVCTADLKKTNIVFKLNGNVNRSCLIKYTLLTCTRYVIIAWQCTESLSFLTTSLISGLRRPLPIDFTMSWLQSKQLFNLLVSTCLRHFITQHWRIF